MLISPTVARGTGSFDRPFQQVSALGGTAGQFGQRGGTCRFHPETHEWLPTL